MNTEQSHTCITQPKTLIYTLIKQSGSQFDFVNLKGWFLNNEYTQNITGSF